MTSPDEAAARTRVDPGRPPPRTGPGGADDAATVLDPGRSRRDDEPATALDPGRPERRDGPDWARTLPPELTARFEVARELPGSGAQADLFVVRERATDLTRVLKVYRSGWVPDEQVRQLLLGWQSPHLVKTFEAGRSAGRSYEIMEYLAGENLFQLRRGAGAEFDLGRLKEIVRQVAEALNELHARGVVHRDVKPANLLIRKLSPFDVVVIDLGISRYLDGDEERFTRNRRTGTLPFTPPEYVAGGQISPAYDWWSLGMTLVQLATGQPMFAGVENTGIIRSRLVSYPIGLTSVRDPRLRLLCAGLLLRNPDDRWGARQVSEWLADGSPEVAWERVPTPGDPDPAVEPYVYNGQEYRDRELLAAAMTSTWELAAQSLYGRSPEPLRRLTRWLRQFPAVPASGRSRRRRLPVDVRLVRQLRAIDPAHPPVYRDWNITPRRLPELAREAWERVGTSEDVVGELFDHELLPLLATGGGAAELGLGGGSGLVQVWAWWRREERRLMDTARALPDGEARTALASLLQDERTRIRALALFAATATDAQRSQVRRTIAERRQELNLPWFTELADRQDRMWLAFALLGAAAVAADRREIEERAARVRREWLRRTEWLREWSRRQNRAPALARAVSGVCALVVLLFALVGVSDMTEVASDAAILDAWFALVAAAALTLTAEALLAWEIGGRFHPGYSLLGAGLIAVGRAARALRSRGVALPAIGGFLAVAGILTVFLPVVTPVLMAGVVVVWAVVRYASWQADVARERAELARPEPDGGT